MEPNQSFPADYPVFEADQVLTSDDLNALFDHLDTQERLTRTRLIGMGIVCGLEVATPATGNTISISRGCGLTSWGYLVVSDPAMLTRYRSYEIPEGVPVEDQYPPFTLGAGKAPLYELLTDAEYDNLGDTTGISDLGDAPGDFLGDKAVVLYLEMSKDNLKHCLTGDCDNKGIDMVMNLKRLLVGKDVLASQNQVSGGLAAAAETLPDLFLKRINVPATAMGDFEAIYQAYTSLFDAGVPGNIIDGLSAALDSIYVLINPLLADFPQSPFTRVKTTLLKRLADLQKNVPYAIQYYYDFLDDLLKAYAELKEHVRFLISECCPDEGRFPLHLVLGMARGNTTGHPDALRQYFIYSPLFNRQGEGTEAIRLLFLRIKVMIDNFFVPAPAVPAVNVNQRAVLGVRGSSMRVKITPSDIGDTPLSRRAIPYYYQIDDANPIQVSWDYQKTQAGKANRNLSYNADKYNTLPDGEPFISPLLYSMEPYNFFRIEGHIGQNYLNVLRYITGQQNTYRLPFDLVAVKLGTDAADIQPDITCSFSDLEAQYDLLKSELYCALGDQQCFYARQPFQGRIPGVAAGNTDLATGLSRIAITDSGATAQPDTGSLTASQLANFNATSLQLAVSGLRYADVLKYTTIVPAYLRPILQMNVYAKGQFLSGRPCFSSISQPPAGATNIGLVYLSRIKAGAIPAYLPDDINLVPDYLLRMTDLIEEVISTVFYAQLGYFDADVFTTRHKALTTYAAAFRALLEKNPDAKNVPAGLAGKLAGLPGCSTDRFSTLKQEYELRYQKLQQALLFNNFITKNPGIDHKAGVPRGGTFVLVYYEKPPVTTQPTAGTAAGAALRTAISSPADLQTAIAGLKTETVTSGRSAQKTQYIPGNLLKSLSGIVQDKKYGFTTDQQQAILGIITQKTPTTALSANTGIVLPDKGVVADFYLPYICRPGCGGTTYVFVQDQAPDTDPVITLTPTEFCSGDTKQYPVTVQPGGGSLTGDGITAAADGSFVFVPAGLAAGAHMLSYKLEDKTAILGITVTAAPGTPNFEFRIQSTTAGGVVNFHPSSQPEGLQFAWDFGDGTTGQTLVPDPHSYTFTGNSADYKVTLSVINGPCTATVTKSFTIKKADQPPAFALTPNRFVYNDPGVYPFVIYPPVTQAAIVKTTTDPNQLSNPDGLSLAANGNALSLKPAMADLPATLVSALRYQNIPVTVTIVRPVSRFTIAVKTTARSLATFRAAAPAASATIRFTALDTAADSCQWQINGKPPTELVPGTAAGPDLEVKAATLVRALGAATQWVIELTLTYNINGVTATDTKKAVVTMDQLTAAANKDPFEPKYG